MIDISAYMQKLEWLNEWIEYRVDHKQDIAMIIFFYQQYGLLIHPVEIGVSPIEDLPFEKYYQHKLLRSASSER